MVENDSYGYRKALDIVDEKFSDRNKTLSTVR